MKIEDVLEELEKANHALGKIKLETYSKVIKGNPAYMDRDEVKNFYYGRQVVVHALWMLQEVVKKDAIKVHVKMNIKEREKKDKKKRMLRV